MTTPAATPELFDSATAGGAQPVLPSEPPLVLPPNEIPAATAEALPLATDEPAGTDEPGTTAEPAATAEAPAATAEAPVIATTPPPTDEPADPATVVPTAEATAPPVTVTAAPPLADFTVEPGEVAAGRPITINNSSSGDITTWAWDFGDGTGTDAASPAPHTYAAAGVYTIRLTVSGPGGTAAASRQVIVTGSGSVVEAIFSVAPGSAQDACFSSSSTGPIQSHAWDFGDGRRSSEPNPCHTYAAPGTYTVSLTVTGSDGISSSATRSITILAAEPPPAAAFTVSPSAGVTATTFQFQDTTSGLVSGWSWAFGDGATSSDRSPSHRYAQPGTYTATLTVTGPGGTSTASQSVTVQAPLIQLTCDFAAPGTPFEATPVALDGTAGNNIDGAALSYRWTVNGTEIATTEDTTYTFSAGYYTVTFTASPENGTPCSRSRSFNVLDAEGLYAEFDQSETRAPAGSEICFTDRTFGPVAGWSWSFGDGGSSSEPNPCHTYTTPGRYSITLTASAADGRQDSATAPVTIFATDQSLAILASATAGTAPLTVQFDAQQTGIDPATLLWGFPGGVQAAGSSVTYTFRAPGTYTVNLSGSGVQGAASASARIVVGEATGLRAAFTPSRWQGRAPAEICFTDQSAGDALQTWEWSLGDGQTASVASPCITYRRAGTYDVRLTVTNAHGQSASATNRITILAPVDDDSRSTPTPATTVPTTAAATPTTTDTATVTVTVTATPAAPVAVTVTTTPTAAVTITPEEDDSRSVKAPAPYITVFDPSLSKIGYLPAGSTGLPGEELVWEIIVSNVSALVETGIVVTDTIRNDLRIDRVEGSAGVNVSYSGQVVTASIATLPPGQSRRFWVYTTVLSSPLSGQFTNTAYPNRGLPAAATVNVPAAPPSGPLPVVSGVTDVSDFAGQQSCFNASLTNSGAPGYGPYLLVVLPPGVTFNSASFLTGGVVNVPTTRPSPDNGRWVDPVSGQTITVPVGGSLVVFRLPVGSVVTGNPPLVANICVTTDPLATPGVPLPVQVYGGYEFGSTPTGEGGSIVNPVPDNSTITPTLITFDKTNNAPEGERPPGPGWSYQYTLNVELAAGQTLNNVVVRDVMPNMPGQLAFQYTGPTTFGGTCLRGATTITPPAAGNGQTLTISLASLRETTLTQPCTLSITYTGYILDVLAENGTLNELDIINRASFDFDHATLPSPTLTDTNVVQAEHVTFQKLVNPAVAVPGDTLTYTINFQVTDYNSATQIVVVDIMPDGLSYVVGSGEIAIPGFTGGITPVIVPNGDGSLRLTFNVLAAAGQPAIAAGSAGTLTYQATIDQLYRSPVEPVRASDELTNAVTGGYTLTDGATDTNGSTADVLIQPITLTKETVTLPRNGIAAIHGETVRFRLTMTIPSGDTRAIVIEDFLPLPVFDVDDPDYGLRAGVPSALPFLNTSGTCAGYPTPTNPTYERCGIYVGPASTLPGVVPQSITINPATNSVRIVVGDVSTTAPQVLQFDLVVGVIALPFADDLFLANQSRVTSLNTPGLELRADSLDYIRVGAPDLTLRKGVLSTSNGSSTIEPVTSPVDGNLFDADAGDVVTYRLTITNIGTSRAYDVTITDPGVTGLVGCAIVPGSVRNGAGTALAFTGDILTGIRLTDPLPDGRTGNPNLARVTVDVRCTIAVTATPAQEELVNEASVVWSGLPGAPAYPPRADQAFIFFTDPILAKTGTPPLATIGQVVTYTLRATLPDGTLYNTRLVDTLPAGMALVACDSITVSGSVSTDLAGGFSAACAAPGNPTVAASGGQPGRLITWNLGEVVTGSSTGAGAATITIVYRAVILNLTAIDRGDRLINTARLEWDDVDGDGNDVVPDTHPTTTVIEPTLRVSKTAAPATGDAGDTITYTLVISHAPASDATAHDITLSDIIPAGATYVAGSVVHTDGVVPATLAESGGTVSATWGSLTTAQTSTFTYQVTLNSDVQPQQRIINTVNIAWTSLAGSPTNTAFNPNGVERTGNTANPGQRHDYRASSTATVTVNAPALAKSIIGTSEAFTTGNNVAVGELVRYRVSVTVPEGETRNAVLVDTLDAGLAFMNLTTAALASITFPAGVTAGAGIGTDILAAATVNADGSSATFTFGTLTNSNSSAAAEVIVIEYTVVVLDSSAIARGTQVNNSARLTYRNGFSGTTASLTASAANVTVVEPTLRVLKTASPATGDAGDTITFTLVVNHTLPPSNATAFDIVLTDVIPAGMVYVAGTLQHTAGIAPATLVQAAGTITATWDGLTTAQSSTLTFQVRLLETVQPGDTITNTASITYDSLPADNVVDQSPYNSASDERDYSASGSAPVSITGSSFDKDVTGTSVIYTGSDEFDPGIVDLNIDEEVTFTLITVIPEGTINGVQVIDTLPVGLRYVSSVVLPGSSLSIGGSLTPGVVGRTITWNLGTVTNLPDNLSTPGDVLTIRITAVAEDIPSNVAGVRLTNSATFRFTGGQPLTDTADVEIVEPRLQIDKSSPVTEGDAGDIIPYTVVVSHMPTSTSDAYDLVITDLMVPGLQLLPGTVTTSLGTIVTGNGAGDTTVRVNVPRLARGVSLTITYQARLANTVRPGQQLVNTATAGYDDKEGPGTRETTITDTHTVRVTAPQFSKAIVATSYSGTGSAAYDPANPDLAIGETVTYELVVTLPEGTAPITITDTLPAGLTLLSSRVTSLGGVTTTGATAGGSLSGSALAVGATGTVAGSQLTYAFGTLTNTPNGTTTEGDRVRILIVARLVDDPANADGQVKTNNATLNYGTGSLSASASADVVEPLIELVKTFNPDSASVGSTVDLTLVLTNSSTQPAFEIRLTDPIHSSLRLDSVSVNVTGTAGTTFTGSSVLGAGGQVIVSFNQLLPGESVTVTARVTILLNAVTQVIPNVATVTYDNLPVGSADNAFDRNASATGADDLTITRVIDLALVKTVSNTTPYIGDSVVYTLRATNNGPATATAVRVTDILPAGLTVTAFTPTTSCTYTAATRALNCAYASLAPTASVTITVTATVASTAIPGQQLTNSAATFASESGLNYSNETDATNNEDDVTITVGRLASVGDLLWYDANVNGVQDAGEAGVPGVTVYLLNSLGVIVRTDVTDSNGIYGFTGLRAGTYSVRLLSTSYPAGAVLYEDIYDGDRNGLSTFTLTESQALLDVDFAFIRRVSLGDRVWRDTNNNGVQDSGEPGIPGVTVILRGTDLFGNPVAASMPTGATGLYNFNVLPGTYTVSISTGTLPIALTPSYDLDGIATPHTTAVTVVNGVPRTDVDFGYAPTGSIGDRVWFDVNGNGLQETGETGLPGVTLTLTGTTLFGEVIAPRTAITGVNGIYSFSNVEAGTYTVTVTPPAGYTPTFDLNGGRDNRTLVGMGYGVVRTD
ncbi:MAG: PKD domain-containing protein, partial [Anaerolineae bacterium]|nr:PKD domain-containing protein [Anaerolineae bacterium]